MSSATIAQRAGLKEDAVITHSKLGSQGRLGNQLFQYAFLFAQARRTRCRAFVNGDAPGFTLHPFALDSSGTVVLVSHHEYMGLYEREISTRVEEPTFQYDSDLIRARDACDYSGYFQSERYFCQFAKDVRSLFLLDDAATSDAERWKRWITVSKNDVAAVHVRRGDYLGKPAVHANLHRTTYHQRAIELLRCRLARPCNVLVFSDDIPWCRRHRLVRSDHGVRYVSGLDAYTDLYLQSVCKHHVIANSSFSWWGAWLSDFPEQQVVAPGNWFGPEGPRSSDSVYCDSWIVL